MSERTVTINPTQNKNDPSGLSKVYDPLVEEPKWQAYWRQQNLYHFDPTDSRSPTYSIDTPPPYPSGEFHVGNALNWSYIDFVARYRRMKGYNVHFPQGWDCHGLPTEVKAEQTLKIRKNDIPAAKFVEECRKITEEFIDKMRVDITRLGISSDWKLEYRTMDPSYYKQTQLSFIHLYKTGYMYRGEHPVNWCPRCETAIAEAEVSYIERQGSLFYMRFGREDELEIASTRPELLGACVAIAVHPKDTRYESMIGRTVQVPVFSQEVTIIPDEEVDMNFGTGAVMVCTFGDKTDVKWQKKYNLPIIREITENGRINLDNIRFNGLRIEEARRRVVEDLEKIGKLLRTEKVTQNIGTCWRCKTPVEIISRPQWFMKTREMTQQVKTWAEKLEWIPDFARQRLIDWAESLDWDWVVSRQRIFATPIPVWYCKNCREIILPDEKHLPVDPRTDIAPSTPCPKCKSAEKIPDVDVFDTWMDSSITAPIHAGWPSKTELFMRLFPADLQPNGVDIIRTWDYYLLVRSLALFGKAPYRKLMINGMVRGTDGRMMSKSLGNTVRTGEVLGKLGADAFRQWAAAGGATGYDIPFRWNEAEYGKKFLTKLWNIARFIITNTPGNKIEFDEPLDFSVLDRWLLGSLQQLVSDVTEAFENFQFNIVLEKIRDFTWHSLADDYIEAVKYRLYPESNPKQLAATVYALRQALAIILKLLAPICPHVTEAIFQELRKDQAGHGSIHSEHWPTIDKARMDPKLIAEGKTILEIIAYARRKKSEKGISLKTPLKQLVVSIEPSAEHILRTNQEPILRTLKAEALSFKKPPSGSDSNSKFDVELVV